MKLSIIFTFVLMLSFLHAKGQEQPQDSVSTIPAERILPADTLHQERGKKVITIDTYADRYNPRKAILYAAIFPGSGQLYNKKYWKVPLVYAGFATGIFFIDFYQRRYLLHKNELFTILETGEERSVSGFNEVQLRNIIDDSKRERDFMAIITGFWYILQLVDAHVDAHLKEFDLNPQLQVKLEPVLNNSPWNGQSAGIALTFTF